MPNEAELAEVKKMIQSFYRLAQQPAWQGEVNDRVAEVVTMASMGISALRLPRWA